MIKRWRTMSRSAARTFVNGDERVPVPVACNLETSVVEGSVARRSHLPLQQPTPAEGRHGSNNPSWETEYEAGALERFYPEG